MVENPWLCYSVAAEGAFCKPCALFMPSNNREHYGQLVNLPFTQWKMVRFYSIDLQLKKVQGCDLYVPSGGFKTISTISATFLILNYLFLVIVEFINLNSLYFYYIFRIHKRDFSFVFYMSMKLRHILKTGLNIFQR